MEIDKNNLPVMEMFYSLQGEGYYSGSPAFFIRIGGCDVGCGWCDVKESWDHGNHNILKISKIIDNIDKKTKIVVITGGEPLMWDMTEITKKLKEKNLKRHLETSGTYDISGDWDWICLSPKKRKLPRKNLYQIANELKIIIYNKHDLVFAVEESKKVSSKCKLFLQPEWGKFDKINGKVVDFVKNNPRWTLSLQTHKFLGID
tara:strand:+ start:2810 stop:3418 length:609 start_codon:yes stop_codon:yes gene_type:complete